MTARCRPSRNPTHTLDLQSMETHRFPLIGDHFSKNGFLPIRESRFFCAMFISVLQPAPHQSAPAPQAYPPEDGSCPLRRVHPAHRRMPRQCFR